MKAKTLLVGALIAGAVGIAQVLVQFDATAIVSWETWVVGLVGAFVRPVAVYIVAHFTSERVAP